MKLYQGDCLEVMKDMADKSVDMILTDIPYNEVNDNKYCVDRSKYKGQLRRYNKGIADDLNFNINKLIAELDRVCRGSIYIFCGLNQAPEILNYFKNERAKEYMARLCVWKKTNPTPSNGQHMWLSGTELCVFAKRRKTTFKAFCKSNVWEYPAGTSKLHPTQKPIKLFEYLIKSSTNEGDIVLDCCMGSGTTGVACQHLNRNFIGIELDAGYFNIAKQRIEQARETKELF